jgi:hypothetical protein
VTVRPEVVAYLRENLPKYPADALRRQLYEEGVSDIDFDDCLSEALRAPQEPAAPGKTGKTKKTADSGRKRTAKILLVVGGALIVGGAMLTFSRGGGQPAAPASSSSAAPSDDSSGESGYVGTAGWVVRLPKGYVGISRFKDDARTIEVVHFCKRGTDPTNFIDKGLYGPMGIVQLEVAPSPFPGNPTGLVQLGAAVRRKEAARGEKVAIKNIQIATLPGVQVTVLSPYPRVEAYILGQNLLYFFYAGQEDEIWRAIVLSLRDAHSEN